jgi:hypothetical protein
MMLVEKARAKLYGSYKQMVEHSGSVKTVMQELTFAPAEVYKTAAIDKEELWEKLFEATRGGRPVLG